MCLLSLASIAGMDPAFIAHLATLCIRNTIHFIIQHLYTTDYTILQIRMSQYTCYR
jgi:hypothetical protein